jgi:hypothetical protein
MHTLAKNQHHNTRLINFFIKKAYKNGAPTIQQLIDDNIINGTQLAEIAVSRVYGIPMCEIGEHRDLQDDSDVKTITVQHTKVPTIKAGKKNKKVMNDIYVAAIKNVNQKIGVLRVICYNPFSDKYHFFKIPASAYYSIKYLKISFNKETQEPLGQYAKFEVENFDEVSTPLTTRELIDTKICSVDRTNITAVIDYIVEFIEKKPAEIIDIKKAG